MTLPGTEGDNRDRTGRAEAAVRARDLGIVIGNGTLVRSTPSPMSPASVSGTARWSQGTVLWYVAMGLSARA